MALGSLIHQLIDKKIKLNEIRHPKHIERVEQEILAITTVLNAKGA